MRALDGLRLRYVLVVIPHLRILWVGDMFFCDKAGRADSSFPLKNERREGWDSSRRFRRFSRLFAMLGF